MAYKAVSVLLHAAPPRLQSSAAQSLADRPGPVKKRKRKKHSVKVIFGTEALLDGAGLSNLDPPT